MESLFDLTETTFKSICRQKLRALAAVLAVAIAVFGMIMLAGRSLRSQKYSREIIYSMVDLGLLTIRQPAEVDWGELTPPRRQHLEIEDASALAALPGVARAVPLYRTSAEAKYSREVFDVAAIGADPSWFPALGVKLIHGRAPNPKAETVECLLSFHVAKYINTDNLEAVLDKPMRLGGHRVQIVGVYDRLQVSTGESCIVPPALAKTIAGNDHPTSIVIRLSLTGNVNKDFALLDSTRKLAGALLSARFGEGVGPHLVVGPADNASSSADEIIKVLLSQAVFLTLGMLIAIATVTELLYTDVRTNYAEIGILRALGATKCRIAAEIFARGMLICFIGGLVGITLAHSYYFWPEILRQQFRWESFPQLTYIAFILSAAAGLVASIAPALNAVSVPPITTMRESTR